MQPLRVLYVGGFYQAELSLYYELMNNPAFEGCFCTNKEPHFHDNIHNAKNRAQINEIKSEFKPDLTLFRSWNTTSRFAAGDDIVWLSEKNVILHSGGKTRGPGDRYAGAINAYQDLDSVKKHNGLWLPYCVSKHFEKKNEQKDYDVLCITTIPTVASGGVSKKVSTDILLKPLYDKEINLTIYGKDRLNIPYIKFKRLLKPPDEIVEETAKAKIFISPTTIWFDPYAISHKTVSTMGCGVLTMTNKYGAIEEILGKHKETILYSNTPEETVELVEYYLDHDKEREEIAKAGYDFVHTNYDWGDHLLRIYDEVKCQNI
jgi:glycosyltransferase involved in cell wall biosynthesis